MVWLCSPVRLVGTDPERIGLAISLMLRSIPFVVGGGLLLLVVGLLFSQDGIEAITGGSGQDTGSQTSVQHERAERCRTGEDPNRYTDCRMIATVQSLDQLWEDYLPRTTGEQYVMPGVQLFEGRTNTGAGRRRRTWGRSTAPPT